MGKAGILEGGKGDIMIPSAHIFEVLQIIILLRTNLKNIISRLGIDVYEGSMVTVLGTSLQNKDILKFLKIQHGM